VGRDGTKSGFKGEKKLQGCRHKRILGTTESITGYLVKTRATGNEGTNGKEV
jgi:hypothetical protein